MKYIAILFLTFTYLNTNAQGIEFFQGSFEEAKAEAKKQDKLIFMDAYAAWCGPCKRMAKNVFPKKEAGDYFNANFINFKQDMEKGEGRKLAKKYGVGSYPTLIFIDFNGDVVYKTKGARSSAQALINLGKKALQPSKKTLKLLKSKWDNGNREKPFLKQYIKVKALLGENNNEVLTAYLNTLTTEEKATEENKLFVYNNTKNASSIGIDFISSSKAFYKAKFGKESFDKKINTIAVESATAAAKSKNNKALTDIKTMLKKLKPTGFKKQTSYIETKYYGKTKQWNAYDKAVTKYLKKYKKGDVVAYRSVAWNYYMNIDDTPKLLKAEKWMQAAIKKENTYENNLTQAYLLYKLNKYSEAQDAVEYAIILAKDSKKKAKNAQILKGKIEKAIEDGEKKVVEIGYDVK